MQTTDDHGPLQLQMSICSIPIRRYRRHKDTTDKWNEYKLRQHKTITMLSIQCAKKNRAANDQKQHAKKRDEKGNDSGDVRYQLYAIIVFGVSTRHVCPTADLSVPRKC